MVPRTPWTRRDVLRMTAAAGLGTAAAACASEPESPTEQGARAGKEPSPVFNEPATALSGSLTILVWSHFVPSHDEWFDQFATDWGEQVGVDVRVDHVDVTNVPTQIASELQAGQGHDLMQYIATLSQFEPSVLDLKDVNEEANNRHGEQLKICTDSSYNPHTASTTRSRRAGSLTPATSASSLWEPVGLPDGPATWDDLLDGRQRDHELAERPARARHVPGDRLQHGRARAPLVPRRLDPGRERECRPELAGDARRGRVDAAALPGRHDRRGLRVERRQQQRGPDRRQAELHPELDLGVPLAAGGQPRGRRRHVLRPGPRGAVDRARGAARDVQLHRPEGGQEPGRGQGVPAPPLRQLRPRDLQVAALRLPVVAVAHARARDWLADDPFGSNPSDKLAFLGDVETASQWSTSIGHPGPSSPAIGEILGTYVIPNMFASAVRGDASPEAAVQQAHRECERVFANWRQRGLIGGG